MRKGSNGVCKEGLWVCTFRRNVLTYLDKLFVVIDTSVESLESSRKQITSPAERYIESTYAFVPSMHLMYPIREVFPNTALRCL